jgi:hypothetical protein
MIYHILFTHSSIEWYFELFPFLIIVKSAAMNIYVQVLFAFLIPNSGIAWSYGNHIEEVPDYFSQQLHHLTFLPVMYEVKVPVSPYSPNTCYFPLFLFIDLFWGEVGFELRTLSGTA